MINRDGFYELEVVDEILINKFIRNGIKFEKFLFWYKSLKDGEQSALVSTLFEFAYQAGVNDSIINDAYNESEVSKSNELIQRVLEFKTDLDGIEEWYLQLTLNEKYDIFIFSVYLFGIAENNVFINFCSNNTECDHWWHRDLLDDDIVTSLKNNPEYYLSSKKDDL